MLRTAAGWLCGAVLAGAAAASEMPGERAPSFDRSTPRLRAADGAPAPEHAEPRVGSPGLPDVTLESYYGIHGSPSHSLFSSYAEDVYVPPPRGFWIFGGFAYRLRFPDSGRFDRAEELTFSVASMIPNEKAPFVVGLDMAFARYRDPSVPSGEEYEVTTGILSVSTWVAQKVPVYIAAGVGAVAFKLPSNPDDAGSGLALETRGGVQFPAGRFDMAVEWQYFWGNAEGTILDGHGVGVRLLARF